MTRVLQVAARAMSLALFALPLMRRLRDAGYDVEAMAGFDGYEEQLRQAGFVVHPWRMGHTSSPLRVLQARRQLRAFLARRHYDLVHTHCSFGGIVANPVAHRSVGHVLYTQHGFYVHEGLNAVRRRLWLEIEKVGLRHAHTVICVSQAERELALTLGVGAPGKFFAVPGAGVPIARFGLEPAGRLERRQRLRAGWQVSDDVPVLLTVSRLTWDKGYAEMIEAVRQLRSSGVSLRMFAAGSGKDEVAIRNRIRQAGLEEDFILLGWRDDVMDLYAAADLFVFASHREGLPISPIEAMASGLPMVAADIPGCREELQCGDCGLLFPVGDARSLADRVRALLDDPSLRRDLAQKGPGRAADFDVGRVVSLQVELYRQVEGEP